MPAPADARASVPLSLIEDPTLTWGAKGLLIYLLSQPEDQLTEAALVQASRNGPVRLRRLLRELRKREAIEWRQRRAPGGELVQETFRLANARQRYGDVAVDYRPNRNTTTPPTKPARRRLDFDVR